MSQYLSLAEAADYLDVGERTISRYIRDGKLPAARVADTRLIRIRRSDLDALFVPIQPGEA